MRNTRWLVLAGLVAASAGCAAPSNQTGSSPGYDRYSSVYATENPYYYAGQYYYRARHPRSSAADHLRQASRGGAPDRM
jgi:hypothetical protein